MRVPIVISKDSAIVEMVMAAAAAVNVHPQILKESESIKKLWTKAGVVIIGSDCASMVASLGIPLRESTYLCGYDSDQLLQWSVPLQASCFRLPDQSESLASVLSRNEGSVHQGGQIFSVISGTGGAGSSTLAAGLAVTAARSGKSVALVELDPCGGGIDLLFGAEDISGWRWNDLNGARGHIGDLRGHLPSMSSVDLVSMASPVREARQSQNRGISHHLSAPLRPSGEAIRSVINSLQRSYEVVIVDGELVINDMEWLNPRRLLLVPAHLRAVVAARAKVSHYEIADAALVVRRGPLWRIDNDLISHSLGMSIRGVIPHDNSVLRSCESGQPPGMGRSKFAKACQALWKEMSVDE